MDTLNEHFFEGVEKLLEVWFLDDDIVLTEDICKLPKTEDGGDDSDVGSGDMKKLELVKEQEPKTFISTVNADLRRIPRHVWDSLLGMAKCEIISFTRNANIDAYVLSESSMFVSRRRWILKTCGTTTPLACLQPLLRLAEQLGFKGTSDVFYSRKNFVRPELQASPYRSFSEEVEFLDGVFEDGHSYCLGALNNDCWYLYTHHHRPDTAPRPEKAITNGGSTITIYNRSITNYDDEPINCLIRQNGKQKHHQCQLLNGHQRYGQEDSGSGNEKDEEEYDDDEDDDDDDGDRNEDEEDVPWMTVSPSVIMPSFTYKSDPELDSDQTIEILMQDLDSSIMEIFTKEISASAGEATVRSCIHRLLPGMKIDDYLFEPCGYSMNGINERGEYMTIHITPESRFSYVSFESNVTSVDYGKLIKRVIETFWPKKFLITIFANQLSRAYVEICQLEDEQHGILTRWQRNDLQCCKFPRFKLLFAQYSSAPS